MLFRFHDTLTTIFRGPPAMCAGMLVVVTPHWTTDPSGVAAVLVEVHRSFPDLVIVATFMGGRTMEGNVKVCETNSIPGYQFPSPQRRLSAKSSTIGDFV
jgi:hypothetical protein